jgi:hypothetical protein
MTATRSVWGGEVGARRTGASGDDHDDDDDRDCDDDGREARYQLVSGLPSVCAAPDECGRPAVRALQACSDRAADGRVASESRHEVA